MTAGAAAAIGTVAGSIISGLFNSGSSALSASQQYKNQSKLNKQIYNYNLKLQKHQNAFSQSMFDQSAKLASQAHQIEVNDLRAAGLNPILSANGGNGASVVSPMSGGSAGMSGGSAQSVEPGKIDLINAINSAKQVKNDTQRTENETELVPVQKKKMQSESNNTDANTEYTQEQNKQFKEYNPQVQEKTIKSIQSQIDANDSTTAKNLQEIKNGIARTASDIQVNNSIIKSNKANSAKALDDIKNRPITNSESIQIGPLRFNYSRTQQGDSTYQKNVQAQLKKQPVFNPSYGSYR